MVGVQKFNYEEVLSFVWEGNVSYMESVFPMKEENGHIEPIRLLYPIDEIIEIRNAMLTETYRKGIDYKTENGLFIIPEGSTIKSIYKSELCCEEGSWSHSRQIVITYKHSTKYDGYFPESRANLLKNVHRKLSENRDVNLLVFGDSISYGANSSGCKDVNVSPWMPIYPELFARGIELKYGCKVNLTNPSFCGADVGWGAGEINRVLSELKDLDLAVIAFGMNDISLSPNEFVETLGRIISSINGVYPEADVMIVATTIPNNSIEWVYKQQPEFWREMIKIEKEGVALVNMTLVHKSLLAKKRFADMTGNNINHPNDYLARIYAQTLLAVLG